MGSVDKESSSKYASAFLASRGTKTVPGTLYSIHRQGNLWLVASRLGHMQHDSHALALSDRHMHSAGLLLDPWPCKVLLVPEVR